MVTGITYTQGSTDEGGSNEGNEGDPNKDDSTEEEGGESDEEGGAITPVTPTEPSTEEESNDNDNNNNDNDEPLPYCDSLGASEVESYHDIDDIDVQNLEFGPFSVQGSNGPAE